MLKHLLLPVIVGVILLIAQDRWKDAPTATYTITNPIEIPNQDGNLEFAQEISIFNSGQSVVKDISVKVPKRISTYKLTKHSNQVSEKSFSDSTSFELVYPELPKGQKIRLMVRYEAPAIEGEWISVNHSGGNAQPQEKQAPPVNYVLLWVAFLGGFLSNIILDFRKLRKEWFLRWAGNAKLFLDTKPWFCTTAEWRTLQFDAIDGALERYSYDPIDQKLSYVLLNRNKPVELPEESWSKLQTHATKLLEDGFSREVTAYSSKDKLLDLLKIKKPNALPHHKWLAIQESINEKLKNLFVPEHANATDLIKILEKNGIPEDIPAALVTTIRERAQNKYFSHLQERVDYQDPLETIGSARLDLLTGKQAARLKELAIRTARLKLMPADWSARGLERFLAQGKPEWMSEEEFSDMCDFVSQTNSLADEQSAVREKLATLGAAQTEVDTLKNCITAQLDLIDRVLSNPASIDRFEDYDVTFAPGNRKNLELVASLLKTNSATSSETAAIQ